MDKVQNTDQCAIVRTFNFMYLFIYISNSDSAASNGKAKANDEFGNKTPVPLCTVHRQRDDLHGGWARLAACATLLAEGGGGEATGLVLVGATDSSATTHRLKT